MGVCTLGKMENPQLDAQPSSTLYMNLSSLPKSYFVITALMPGEQLKTRSRDYPAIQMVDNVAQISTDPPLLTCAVPLLSNVNETMDYSGRFVVHPLTPLEYEEWVQVLSSSSDFSNGQLKGIPHQKTAKALLLDNQAGRLHCEVVDSWTMGDSTLYVGRVIETVKGSDARN